MKEYGTKRKSDGSEILDKSNVHKFTYNKYTQQTGDNNLDACYKNFENLMVVVKVPLLLIQRKVCLV